MIVTIDGPAGAGKSTIAKQLAEALGFHFLDTGAMYRAITLGAIRKQIDFSDTALLISHAQTSTIEWKDARLLLDKDDVTQEIRSPIVTDSVKHVADVTEIREALSEQQRRIAECQNIVTEGRDQGTDVFPHAQCKIFLTASPAERAKRRHQQLTDAGRPIPIEQILEAQNRRDAEDRGRPRGSLRPAHDAVIIDTDGLTLETVVETLLDTVRNKMPKVPHEVSEHTTRP
ncbi:MAG: (d)CMP kinase [Pirellulaceae bacterium]|nr:(d)CMP kinase [Pirellulaceae bacterium]